MLWMDTSRVSVNEMRQLEAEAWSALLQQSTSAEEVQVIEVTEAPAAAAAVTRYLLLFDGYREPVPVIGKKTNRTEARFYRDVAPQVPRLVPRCLLHHVSPDWSWLVLADVPDHRPAKRWRGEDVEQVVALLASFHGTFWQTDLQADYPWLPQTLSVSDSLSGSGSEKYGHLAAWHYWERVAGHGLALSPHALQRAGVLAPVFIRAAAGLEVMRRLGGWPDLFEQRHAEAVAELLDDPLPLLQPLRELPTTLLHGELALHHWRLSLLNDGRLLDWRNARIGPPVWDLVDFLERVEQLRRQRPHGRGLPSEETMIDSYLLRMHVGLSNFDARAVRQTLPAAFCLYVVTTWLPRFAEWFQPFLDSPLTWRSLQQLDDEGLRRVGYSRLAGLREYLSDLFVRFWHATRAL